MNAKSLPRAGRKRSFPGFSIQLVANSSISTLLSTAGKPLASADSTFGLTFKVTKRYRKFPNLN
jgi:hypothetical protein